MTQNSNQVQTSQLNESVGSALTALVLALFAIVSVASVISFVQV